MMGNANKEHDWKDDLGEWIWIGMDETFRERHRHRMPGEPG